MTRKYNESLAHYDNSEVMREFVRIAYDSGVISNEDGWNPEFSPDKEKAKYLESLYNVEPSKDKTGRELIENSHQEVKDRARDIDSYINEGGHVETEQEAQDMTLRKVLRDPPNANNIHHRDITAMEDLEKELIVVAEEMNVRGHNDLTKFANDIIKAFNWVMFGNFVYKLLPWLAGAGVIYGASSAVSARVASSNLKMRIPAAIAEVNDKIDKFLQDVPQQSDEIAVQKIRTLKDILQQYNTRYERNNTEYVRLYNNLDISITSKEVTQAEANEKFQELKKISLDVKREINGIVAIVKENLAKLGRHAASLMRRSEGDVSAWENLIAYVKQVWQGISPIEKDVNISLQVLQNSCEEELFMMDNNMKDIETRCRNISANAQESSVASPLLSTQTQSSPLTSASEPQPPAANVEANSSSNPFLIPGA